MKASCLDSGKNLSKTPAKTNNFMMKRKQIVSEIENRFPF